MSFIPSDKAVIKIDLSALRHNFSVLHSLMARGGGMLMPVIKSDAYGHGMKEIACALRDLPLWGFGIYECSEARVLRTAGLKNRLFLLSGLLGDDPGDILELSVTPGIVKRSELDRLDRAADANGAQITVHLKADTGMGRFGMEPAEIVEIASGRHRWPRLHFEGLYTHMSSADEPHDPANRRQIERFFLLLQSVREKGWRPRFVHMANSAALLNFADARFNLARPGIALYGGDCFRQSACDFRPVMSFVSRIDQVRRFLPGMGLSYGHTFTCRRKSVIGVVPVGYDNGYPRSLSNRADVLVRGKRCPVVGNICMKALLVDVTEAGSISPGQEVVLMGRSGLDRVDVCELAQKAGTISYELLCLLGKLNKRIILD